MNNNSSDDTGFEFRPITNGLGFNKKNDLEKLNKAVQSSKTPRENKWAEPRSIQKSLQEDVRLTPPSLPQRKPLGISTAAKVAASSKVNDIPVESAINLFHKLFSWFIDTSLVFITAMASTVAINYFVSNELNFSVLSSLENWVYITGPLFSFYFVFYYSIFWKTTQKTLGMHCFNLTISSKESTRVNLKQTFLRSLIAFVSMFTFGILDILGLPDALTWTSVSKES